MTVSKPTLALALAPLGFFGCHGTLVYWRRDMGTGSFSHFGKGSGCQLPEKGEICDFVYSAPRVLIEPKRYMYILSRGLIKCPAVQAF